MLTARFVNRLVAASLVALVILGTPGSAAADLISVSKALEIEGHGGARGVVDEFLARADVEEQLVSLGVDPEVARLRATSLSAAELSALAGQIETLPAGGDGFLAVLGITFLVLLVLELVGVIDIFNKV